MSAWGLVRWIAFAPSMSTLHAVALSHEHLTYPPLYHLLQHLHCDGNLGGGYLFCICQVVLLYVLFCTFENGKISHLRQLANCRQQRGRAAAFISVWCSDNCMEVGKKVKTDFSSSCVITVCKLKALLHLSGSSLPL